MRDGSGNIYSPLFEAALNLAADGFVPLLKPSHSYPSYSLVPSLLDQECTWKGVNGLLKSQSVRKWAKEWVEKGSPLYRCDQFFHTPKRAAFFHGLLTKLEDAEKGKRQDNQTDSVGGRL